ncbi:hypothetical protein FDP41_005497 [Naegleria fowleri]|uniref:Uncharacterized protein n=1 Tax=Naegleria fowleri TaxID=5763 RepID=A0A6A5BC54_NAEFO|nr:uncharacterized protein FDP41_005497 [Naegleria fowleri]KAF0975503.1 hypothetical protein FDP41_005497 [Naegleria fowleri]
MSRNHLNMDHTKCCNSFIHNSSSDVACNMNNHKLAVIGMSCLFPGHAHNVGSFWNLLLSASETCTPHYPSNRISSSKFKSHAYTAGHFLEKPLDEFDFEFFEISKKEACSMDPQHRLLLQQVYHAFEDAGIPWNEIKGSKTGVFCSVMNQDYLTMRGWHDIQDYNSYTLINTSPANNSARISYHFDLRGPSLTLDTMCSGSLVALNCAAESLKRGECEMAIVAGVNLNFIPHEFVAQKLIGAAAKDGRCKTFSSRADGYGKSEGVGVLILKRFSEALSSNDRIHGLIVGTGVNHDGDGKSGITIPSFEGQLELLQSVYKNNGIEPHQVSYVEAHQTGTKVGDPIECNVLNHFFGKARKQHGLDKLPIGSVKSNIGHTEAVSGIASIIKALLMMKNQTLVPTIHCQDLNPEIQFDQKHLRVVRQVEQLPNNDHSNPIIIGINSFGMGGTNAHAILQSSDQKKDNRTLGEESLVDLLSHKQRILPLAAKSEYSLKKMASNLSKFLQDNSQTSLDQLLYHYCERKSHFSEFRAAVIFDHKDSLIDSLSKLSEKFENSDQCQTGKTNKRDGRSEICLVFSGQGPQWYMMGRQLLESCPVFRETVLRVDQELKKYQQAGENWSIMDELGNKTEKDSLIYSTHVAQPCIFALQIALYEVLKQNSIHPKVVVGHSVGEVAAAYVYGSITFEEAIYLIYHRARLQHKCKDILKEKYSKSGKMMAINLGLEKTMTTLEILGFNNSVEIASINSDHSVVVGGDEQTLKQLQQEMTKYFETDSTIRINCIFLRNEAAFHTSQMDEIKNELLEILDKKMQLKERGTKSNDHIQALFSTVYGTKVSLQDMSTSQYWWQNVRESVKFSQTMEDIFERYKTMKYVIEISPHPVLSGYIKDIASKVRGSNDTTIVLPTLMRKKDEEVCIKQLLASLYVHGYDMNWRNINKFHSCELIDSLPKYPFQLQSCWSESYESLRWRMCPPKLGISHPLLGSRKHNPIESYTDIVYEQIIDIFSKQEQQYIQDHRVQNEVFFPFAGFIEVVASAIMNHFELNSSTSVELCLKDFKVISPMILKEVRTLQVHINTQSNQFRVFSRRKIDLHSIPFSEISKNPNQLNEKLPCDWVLHSYGSFIIKHIQQLPPVLVPKTEHEEKALKLFETFRTKLDAKTKTTHKENLYPRLSKLGLNYGPHFQGLDVFSQVEKDETCTSYMAQVSEPSILSETYTTASYNVWHPALLDACFQLLICSMPDDTTYLPVSTDCIFIYPQKQPKDKKYHMVYATAYSARDSQREKEDMITCDLQVLGMGNEPFISFQGFKAAPLEKRSKTLSETSMVASHFVASPVMIPCQLPSLESIHEFISMFNDLDEYSKEHDAMNKLAIRICVQYCLSVFREMCGEESRIDIQILHSLIKEDHLKKLASLTIQFAENFGMVKRDHVFNTFTIIDPISDKKELLRELNNFSRKDLYLNLIDLIENSLIHMKQQLTGEIDPVTVLFSRKEKALNDYYDEVSHQTKPFFDFIVKSILTHKSSSQKMTLRILELGAGLGGTTKQILPILHSLRDFLDVKYVFSDISTLFLMKAKEKFAEYQYFMDFMVLNIEKALPPSIEKESFDIVIAANVVHATKDLSCVLSLVNSLLVSYGQLFLVESDPNRAQFLHYFVGTLKGWWYFKDSYRGESALLSRDEWKQALSDCGFKNSVCMSIHSVNYMVAQKDVSIKRNWLFFTSKSKLEDSLAHSLSLNGVNVIQVSARVDASFTHDPKMQSFEIDPTNLEHFHQIFHQVPFISGIIFGWPLGLASKENNFSFKEVSDCVDGLYSICKNLKFNATGTKLVALTSGAFAFENHINISQSPIVGCLRSIYTEMFKNKLKVIDIVTEERSESLVARDVANDILSPQYSDDEIVYSDNGRFIHYYSVVDTNTITHKTTTPSPYQGHWVITGGLGGIGLAMCEWLISKMGVKHIALLARRQPKTDEQYVLDRMLLNHPNASISVHVTDICDSNVLYGTLKEIHQKCPITAVVHAAMVLADCAANKMTRSNYEAAAKPKIIGAFNLHKCTMDLECNLSVFLMLSSFSSLVGAFAQSNYNSGNLFLETLCKYRRNCGLAAQSIGLSLITGAGWATKAEVDEYFWVGAMHISDLLDHVEDLIAKQSLLPPALTFFGFDIPEDTLQPHIARSNKKSTDSTRPMNNSSTLNNSTDDCIGNKLKEAIAKVFGISANDLLLDKPLVDFGLDSLMAVEIRNWLSREFNMNVTVSTLLSGVSTSTLMDIIANSHNSQVSGSSSQNPSDNNNNNRNNELSNTIVHNEELLECIQDHVEKKVLICFPALGSSTEDLKELSTMVTNHSIYVVHLNFSKNKSDWTLHFFELWAQVERLFKFEQQVTVYGHSMGALVALEFTRFIQSNFNTKPMHLIVSANTPNNALHSNAYKRWKENGDETIIYAITDYELFPTITANINDVEQKASKIRDLLQIPTFRNQFDFLLLYHSFEDDMFGKYQVECPITVFRGQHDKLVTEKTIHNWDKFAASSIRKITLEGVHHNLTSQYLKEVSKAIILLKEVECATATTLNSQITQLSTCIDPALCDNNEWMVTLIESLTPLEQTLFIPFVARGLESQHDDGVIFDRVALDILSKLPHEWQQRTSTDGMTRANIVGRTLVFDRKVLDIVHRRRKSNKIMMVVNLGCGLCSRYERLFDRVNDGVYWIDVDLKNVIELREKVIRTAPQNLHYRTMSGSILEKSTYRELVEIRKQLQDGQNEIPVLVIAEGLFLYFDHDQLVKIFEMIENALPLCDVLFEMSGLVPYLMTPKSVKSVNKGGPFKSFVIDANTSVRSLHKKAKLISEHYQIEERQQLGGVNITRYPFVPPSWIPFAGLLASSMRVLHIQFQPHESIQHSQLLPYSTIMHVFIHIIMVFVFIVLALKLVMGLQ